MQSVLAKSADVVLNPYPHLVIDEALDWGLYDALSEAFPEDLLRQRISGENMRGDIHARERCLPGVWQEFVDYHTSKAFWLEVAALFGPVFRLLYYGIDEQKPFEEWDTVVRGVERGDLNMDCQPGINTPQTEAGRVRGPHLDNPIELFAGMLYMGEGEGDLEICKIKRNPTFHGKLEIHDECVEVVDTVKYRPNQFVMFVNSTFSVHSVTPRQPTDQCRRLCNFIGEMNFPLFKVGHGRY